MINVLIVDDEKPGRDELEYLLKGIPDINISGIAADGSEALLFAERIMPDLVFLDIKMPEMNGFEVAEKLQINKYPPGIIFTTAYDKFALKAFEINALDYILKPFIRERLIKSIDRYISRGSSEKNSDFKSISRLMEKIQNIGSSPTHITISRGEHYRPIPVDSIIAVAADGRGVKILSTDGEFSHFKSITEMDELLDSGIFFRCHRSYLININHINKIDIWFNNTYQLEMGGISEKIPVSRSYISRFREIMSIN